jgi:hypothetical protein
MGASIARIVACTGPLRPFAFTYAAAETPNSLNLHLQQHSLDGSRLMRLWPL